MVCILLLFLSSTFCVAQEKKILHFIAGNPISFNYKHNEILHIVAQHNYGSTVLKKDINNESSTFTLPDFICKKTGIVTLTEVYQNHTNTFDIKIEAKKSAIPKLENYLGPKSILAGKTDFTMLTSMATDEFDNLLPDGTPITIQQQYYNSFTSTLHQSKNGFVYKRLYSKPISGKITVNTLAYASSSSEIQTTIEPFVATHFTIATHRNHEYADGNEIISITTNTIKDIYGNTVADGTLVHFAINNGSPNPLHTQALTVNGIATAMLLHPEAACNWEINAFITDIAKSNTVQIAFKEALQDIDYSFNNCNRTLQVGPLKSYMNQIIPDGIQVVVRVINQEKQITTQTKTTRLGICTFQLSKHLYPKNNYAFEIEVMGKQLKTKTINVEQQCK